MGVRVPAAAMLLAAVASGAALANPANDRQHNERDRNERGGVEAAATIRSLSVTTTDRGQIFIDAVIVISNTGTVWGAPIQSGARRIDEDKVDLSGVPILGGLFGGGDDDDDEDGPLPRLRIGHAYYLGDTLAIDLSEPAPPPVPLTPEQIQELEAGLEPAQVAIGTRLDNVAQAGGGEVGIDYHWQDRPFELEAFKLLNTSYSYNMAGTQFVNIGYMADPPAGVETGGRSKIPVLGDVPLLGNLFTRRAGDAYLEDRTLVVLIKPSILEDDYE